MNYTVKEIIITFFISFMFVALPVIFLIFMAAFVILTVLMGVAFILELLINI